MRLPPGFSVPPDAKVKGVNLEALGIELEKRPVPHSEEPAEAGGRPKGQAGRRFRNRYVLFDGYTFHSEHEAERYKYLRTLENGGAITALVVHPRYALVVEGELVTVYTADFRYRDEQGRLVVEDAKSKDTKKLEGYRLRKKLMKILHKIEVIEV